MPVQKSKTATRSRSTPRSKRAAPIVEASLPGELDNFWYTDSQTGAIAPDSPAMRDDGAMRISTVAACVRLLADTVASLPCKLYKSKGEGKVVDRENAMYRILHDQPNPEQTAFEFWEYVMVCLLLRGNFYALKESGRRGVSALWPVNPDHVRVRKVADRTREYEVRNEGTFLSGGIVHIMGLSLDGIVGVSPIEYHATTLAHTYMMELSGMKQAENGSQIRGVLKHPGRFGGTDRKSRLEEFRRQWNSIYAGPLNAGRVAILEEAMEFQPISMTNQDAQWIETRKFERTQICSIFRVPPHMIGDLERATFSNIEHQDIGYEKHSVRPWLVRIERTLKRDLLSADSLADNYAEFQADALLRGDVASRTNALSMQFRNGAITLNEWRSLENRNPIDDELGDQHFVPRDLATFDQLKAELELKLNPPQEQVQPPAPEPQRSDESDAVDAAVEDAAMRLHACETRALERGEMNKAGRERWASAKLVPYARVTLRLLDKLTGRQSAEAVVRLESTCVASGSVGADERLSEIRKILEVCYAS